jgi:CheY-like chemotaxis protein
MAVSQLSRRHLLIVEDDELVLDTIVLMLEDDYEILVAGSVGTALSILQAPQTYPIDIVLLDCLLPGGSVADVLSQADRQSIPAVLISGDPSQAESLDPNRQFLRKPFSQATLRHALDTARR